MPIRLHLADPEIEHLLILRMYVTTDWFMISAMFNMFMRKMAEDGQLMTIEDARDTYMALRDSWPFDKRFREAMLIRQNDPERLRGLLGGMGVDPNLPWRAHIDV